MRCDICGNRTPVVRRWRNAWLCQCCYRKAIKFERERAEAARLRTFISSTTAAVGGEQVIVASPTHRRSTDTFERYCKWLGKAEPLSDLYGVNKANRTVRFDGGGSVQFVTLSGDMKGRRPESVLLDDMEEHE